MKKSERLFEAIGQLPPELVEEALCYEPPLRENKRKGISAGQYTGMIAAILVLVMFAVPLFGLTAIYSGGLGSSGGYTAGANPGAAGNVYSSYAGPVFPLLSREDPSGVTAERNVDFDFASDMGTSALVEDSYILTNRTETEQTLELLYPTLYSIAEETGPDITVDGQAAEATVWAGDAALVGGCGIESWKGYETLLEDGRYLEKALSGEDAILAETVTVYEITNIQLPNAPEGAGTWDPSSSWRPLLGFTATFGPETRGILTYGFNSGTTLVEGKKRYGADLSRSLPEKLWLIALGGSLTDYTVEGFNGYNDSGGSELIGVTAEVETCETTLEEILRQLLPDYLRQKNSSGDWEYDTDEAFILGLCVQLARDGIEEFAMYDTGMLEEIIGRSLTQERVAYWSFTVTIPAGGSVTVSARQTKYGSYSYVSDLPDSVKGYDMVTSLGSNLTFTGQTASVSNGENIEITEQNFGFDLENGITRVTLDMQEPEYYLNVRPKSTE